MTQDYDNLRRVEVADTGENHILYQLWDDGDHYAVSVVGELQNPEEYGDNHSVEGSIRDTEDGYEWIPTDDSDADIYIFDYASLPEENAEMQMIEDEDMEELLEEAFNG